MKASKAAIAPSGTGGEAKPQPTARQIPDVPGMTGGEFKTALTEAGFSQIAFANLMGVHRQTIANHCDAPFVPAVWQFALAGVIAVRAAKSVLSIVATKD